MNYFLNLISIRIAVLILAILVAEGSMDIKAQKISRDLNLGLMINQAGYVPVSIKTIVAKGSLKSNFDIIDLVTQKIVYSGTLRPEHSDFGDYSVGDFSKVTTEGHYYIKSDTLRSYPFEISSSAYIPEIDLIVKYFSIQRCGSSTTGYMSPCHVDDGIRMDNGKHQDVSGGWHDASDLRKWVGATIYGMYGLSKTYELLAKLPAREKILDELKWGNQYFLRMQEPQGYVMSFIGGDVQKHSDSNRWTNNVTGKEGGDLKLVKPDAGKSKNDMLIFGTNDNRVIQTDPLDMGGQYIFVISEAIMARITKDSDKSYSQKCLQAATNCFNWCAKGSFDKDTRVIGASMQAALELYKTTGQENYMNFSVAQAEVLKRLQANNKEDGITGFFRTSLTDDEPYKNIWEGCLGFISLCDMIEMFPSHKDTPQWKEMVKSYADNYLSFLAAKNSFGMVPFGLYSKKDPGGNRTAGKFWYRYFMQPLPEWWVGINSNVASAGVGLLRASRVLNEPELKALACRQLDWITGVNPFNSSTIAGVGYNHPKHFGGSSFLPNTPVIPGAVLNGLGGDNSDQTIIGDGNWQISEYWTPMVAFTLWLMAEISVTD